MKKKKTPIGHAKRRCVICERRYVTPKFPLSEGTNYVYAGVCKKCKGH